MRKSYNHLLHVVLCSFFFVLPSHSFADWQVVGQLNGSVATIDSRQCDYRLRYNDDQYPNEVYFRLSSVQQSYLGNDISRTIISAHISYYEVGSLFNAFEDPSDYDDIRTRMNDSYGTEKPFDFRIHFINFPEGSTQVSLNYWYKFPNHSEAYPLYPTLKGQQFTLEKNCATSGVSPTPTHMIPPAGDSSGGSKSVVPVR